MNPGTPPGPAPLPGHPHLVVVGDLVTDVLVEQAGPLAAGSDTEARVRITGGGQAANTAAGGWG